MKRWGRSAGLHTLVTAAASTAAVRVPCELPQHPWAHKQALCLVMWLHRHVNPPQQPHAVLRPCAASLAPFTCFYCVSFLTRQVLRLVIRLYEGVAQPDLSAICQVSIPPVSLSHSRLAGGLRDGWGTAPMPASWAAAVVIVALRRVCGMAGGPLPAWQLGSSRCDCLVRDQRLAAVCGCLLLLSPCLLLLSGSEQAIDAASLPLPLCLQCLMLLDDSDAVATILFRLLG